MRLQDIALPLLTTVLGAAPWLAAAAEPAPSVDQVVVPEVDRREVKRPRIPSNDFALGAFIGTYATENFGSSMVSGLRLGYHITEDFFVEGSYGRTEVSDESFRQVLPGGVFSDPKEILSYYNLSIGYNLLPGEVFLGGNRAKASAFYLIGGVGSTKFNAQTRQTFNFGFGSRLMLADWAALQVDMRDHMFSMDLLGKRQSTHNIEMSAGLMFFF